ncbi:nadh dehydrogenase : Ferredoxin OS=Planctomyces limnophilus (strain ATCC 43296 / DSM 3776 / IFAM 1008 / 290) GN=Plim_3863 PE=4 SV=1: Fer2_4: NADH-G_4Fe-4S_3: Molybdopterin [Gemmata massiliana]|uniref:2Fe-2S ferredoxin-type domain-containing protein n=1 Tax=Gemmata massiliana TaxID=1210884 RepID=A0A6P2CZX0_9BACT|nr:molybdopterin-dependent oxidoreductase [Gemmata massiliana]VTR94403.1 nadh dehydrogenase : Ferredoxin OS=Planctomyces limnophilus (strain ATCC 43296 / DSM 3776 / IFAM 1008 / 290) GN=Plim_3863 PE=4 SV=1: Fer2_4: NADH-G_4Fe-4S_3: Molybdopterin [Gemmata massiliana]
MPTVYVNDKPVEIGTKRLNCVQAAELAGVFVPHYCWHEALSVVASCRMCLVEVGDLKDGKVTMQPKVLPGCQTPVKDGTVIVTGEYDKRDKGLPVLPYDPGYTKAAALGDRAKKSQADTLEGLLINHPLDCPVCDKAGECKLQDFSYKYGRSESRMVDVKNTPANKPHLSSKITLFTDRCIMCTRCVRFTREISGTAELQVVGRGHHEEIDVFPGRPLENKLAGNVVDLCPVGALGSKDFLYKQRVWYLKTTDGVCNRCSTGCSTYVDANKDIVYRVRARTNPQAQGHFICDEGRYGYHHANSGERFIRPVAKVDGKFKPVAWSALVPELKQAFAAAAQTNAAGVVAVLSPFLTVEEAFLLGTYFKSLSPNVRLVLGPVPVVGADDTYPKNVRGEPVEPVKFTIRAEKAPNRLGVEEVLKQLQGTVIPFATVAKESVAAMWFSGGYPDKSQLDAIVPTDWKAPALLVAQDILPTVVTASAKYILPGTTGFEKDGTFVNHANYVQTFGRAARPPQETRSELQLAFDLLGRRGLVQLDAVRKELARAVPFFGALAPETRVALETATV